MAFFAFFVLIAADAVNEDDEEEEEEVVAAAAVVFEATDADGFGAATPMGPAEGRTARKSRVAFLGAAPASAGVELMARGRARNVGRFVCYWSLVVVVVE